MIQTGSVELDTIIKVICEQRDNYAEAVAILNGKLAVATAATVELQKKFDEAMKIKAELESPPAANGDDNS